MLNPKQNYYTMKTNLKLILAFGVVAAFTFLIAASAVPQDKWDVPAEYKNMKNKYAGEDEDGIGEELYAKHCKSCHGKEGYGDGTKSKELKTPMRDFSAEDVQSQTDGELFYKGIIGRDEMPNFEKKITDEEDRWMVVNYMRSLAE